MKLYYFKIHINIMPLFSLLQCNITVETFAKHDLVFGRRILIFEYLTAVFFFLIVLIQLMHAEKRGIIGR